MGVAGPFRYVVRGRVQGVGFRWFVMREGDRLGLQGYVQNLPDGSLEVVARGTPEALGELEQALARGPISSRVDGVEKLELSHYMNLPKSFNVI